MTAPLTGIAAVDDVLKQHEFTNANEAEAMANYLLAIWRALKPSSSEVVLRSQRRQRGRR
jgi:hypothetical protein